MKKGERFCFYINECQDPSENGGYVPSIVYEGKAGHYPCTGDPRKMQTPWVWGKTVEIAKAAAHEQNERLGLSEREVTLIIASSMAQDAIERGRRRRS